MGCGLHKMAAEHQSAYRCDVILEPSLYTTVPHPSAEQQTKVAAPKREVFNPFNPCPLEEQTIRDILRDWVRNKPLLSPAAVRGMVITAVSQEPAYCYRLETFTEQRSVCLRFEPQCKGVSLQPTQTPPEPRPWKVSVTPAKMFTNQVLNYRLVHTDQAQGCPFCQGQKWTLCRRCLGSAHRRCPVCRARGTKRPCAECKGERVVPCASCMTLGHVCCEMCTGEGRLCYFKELRVAYRCHLQHYALYEPGGIPDERLACAAGEILHTAAGPKVQPITSFHKEEVNRASRRMQREACSGWPQRLVIQQRHQLQAVPVTRVRYRWRDTSGCVFIYGVDSSVYWPDYPQRRGVCMCLCCPLL